MYTKKSTLLKITLMVCLGQLAPVYGATPTFNWTATTPGSNLNVGSNWTPVGPPALGEVANFNSKVSGIDFNPVATAPFTTGEMNFLESASPFTFTFTNTSLNFAGLDMVGITGLHRDPTIKITNNNSPVFPQLSFLANISNSFGSSKITVSNSSVNFPMNIASFQVESSAPYTLFDSGANLVVDHYAEVNQVGGILTALEGQVLLEGNIEALDNVSISCKNKLSCGDNVSNNIIVLGGQFTGQNVYAHDFFNLSVESLAESGKNTASNQCIFIQNQIDNSEISIGDSGSIIITNSGINNGSFNRIGSIGAQQYICGPFLSQDNLNLSVSNKGFNTVNATDASGSNIVGFVNGSQMEVFSFTTGNKSSLTFSNTGINNSSSAINDTVGNVGGFQFWVTDGPFLAGDDLTLHATNSGTDGSSGTGVNFTGNVQGQLLFNSIFSIGNSADIQVSNSGVVNGQTTNFVGAGNISGSQVSVVDDFTAGDHLNFVVTNYGENNNTATTNQVAFLSLPQVYFLENVNVGEASSISISNVGVNTQGSSNLVAFIQDDQFQTDGNLFVAKDHFTLSLMNSGTDSSIGTNANFVGYVAESLIDNESLIVRDYANLSFTNSGTNTGSTSTSIIGVVDDVLAECDQYFISGDDLKLIATNTGNSQGSGSLNRVGYTFGLVSFQSMGLGDRADIYLSNTGTQTSGSQSVVGFLEAYGLDVDEFIAGDDLSLTVTNSGTSTNLGDQNRVGVVDGPLVNLEYVSIGDRATITLSNLGSYGGSDPNTQVGFIVTGQFVAENSFVAGKDLTLIATNTSMNPTNQNVGFVDSQIVFNGNAVLNDGSLIKAVNNGTVDKDQIGFYDTLNVLGNVTLEAINTGTVGGNGISIVDTQGGDIDIILQNTSLIVDNGNIEAPLTIGSLTGDAMSIANSTKADTGFIIDTKSGVNTTFAGTLNAYQLIKDGPGTQTLSGGSTVTEVSLVNEGTLNMTGTFNGDILTRAPGILTGTGSINGTLYNSGTTLVNKTLAVTNFVNSGSGVLHANVTAQSGNGLLAVSGNTTLIGGRVLVGSSDGTILFYNPYTILTSGNPVDGTFDSISSVSPMVKPFITYLPNSVVVNLHQNISSAASSHNEREVARVLDATTNPTVAQSLLLSQIVNLSIPEAREALNSLSGEQYANETFYNETINRQFIRRLYDPIRFIVACNPCYDPCGQNLTGWLEVGGNFSALDRVNYMNGYQVTGGAHMRFSESLLIGGALSYADDSISYDNHQGWQDKQSGLVGVYGLYAPSCFYVLADLAYGYTNGEMNREIHIGSAAHYGRGNYGNSQVTFYGESGVDFAVCNVVAIPFVGLEVNSYWRSHFHEKDGDGWALDVHQRNRTAVYSRLGVHLTLCNNYPFRASFDAAWDFRCTQLDNRTRNEFASFEGDFDIVGEKIGRSSFDYALTLEKDLTSSLSGYVETTGQIYNRATTFSVLGGISFNW